MASSNASRPVVAVVTRRVPLAEVPGMEHHLRAFVAFLSEQPGYEGVQVLRRADDGNEEFTVLGRFANEDTRTAFKNLPGYGAWVRRLDAHALAPATIHELHGLEAWFTFPGAPPAKAPPAWKMAAVSYLGVNLVTTALVPLAPRLLGSTPFPWSNFVLNLPAVALLTWVVRSSPAHFAGGSFRPLTSELCSFVSYRRLQRISHEYNPPQATTPSARKTRLPNVETQ
jgi:antibiotic biosynthesis monooxygenase (ABM) superfamily enzyme